MITPFGLTPRLPAASAMSFTVLNACDDFLTTWRGKKKTPGPDDALCRNGAIVFLRGNMDTDIMLGVNGLNTSIAGWDNSSTAFSRLLNHCEQFKRRNARSFRAVPRQRQSPVYMRILEMYLLPGVILIGQCLHFGFHVFNLLRRRKLQDPLISAC